MPISQNPNDRGKRTKVNVKEDWSRRRTSSITTDDFKVFLGQVRFRLWMKTFVRMPFWKIKYSKIQYLRVIIDLWLIRFHWQKCLSSFSSLLWKNLYNFPAIPAQLLRMVLFPAFPVIPTFPPCLKNQSPTKVNWKAHPDCKKH